jgi:hypothetical protein
MKSLNLRFIYLYLFSAIGLVIVVIGVIQGINLAIKTTFFKDADSYQTFYPTYPVGDQKLTQEELNQQKADFEGNRIKDLERSRQRELANTIAMITVGVPLYLYHWGKISKENGQG